MLYDTERGCSLIEPDDLKKNDLYRLFERKNKIVTVKTTFKKLHNFLDEQKPSENSQLVWVRLAKLCGSQSKTPHKDICYFENVVYNTVGEDGKNFLKLSGTLFMIAIAERNETWMTAKSSDTEKYDSETGDEITWRSYWINENFKPIKKSGFILDDLRNKFNKK